MVSLLDVVTSLALLASAIWFGIAAILVRAGLRTAPERAFAVATLLIAVGALVDWLFLLGRDATVAAVLVNLRTTIYTVVAVAILYFGLWIARPRRQTDALAAVPATAVVVVTWTAMTRGVTFTPTGPEWIRDPLWYGVWVGAVAGYLLVSFYFLGSTLRHATFASESTRRKLGAILTAFAATMVLWLTVTAYRALAQGPGPTVSTWILLIPGFAILPYLTPRRAQRLREFLRRLTASPGRPFAAILFHNTGLPLAQVVLRGERALDGTIVANLARAVDHVIATGLKSSAGALRQMQHGEYRLVFEQGTHVTLVVLLRGNPTEALRSEMRLAVRDLEADQGASLDRWEDAAIRAEVALDALDRVLSPRTL